ncbi:MAG: nucleotidyltransferase domain-containing protein [Anaerolineae bacterium]|nr:nucleotidyltransferase domain-containing protein [Anaerolineae bacterium]
MSTRLDLARRFDSLSDQEQQAVSAFVDKIRQRFGCHLESAVLFGSRARGDATPDSDMDVLVVLDHVDLAIQREIRYLAVDVCLAYGIYLSTRVWSHAHWQTLATLQTMLYRNIQQDGLSLLGMEG